MLRLRHRTISPTTRIGVSLAPVESLMTSGGLAPPTTPRLASWRSALASTATTAVEVARCGREVARNAHDARSAGDRALLLQRAARRIARRIGLEVRIRGALPAAPSVVVCNHLSYVDPIAFAQAWPLSAVAKSEVADWPTIGRTLEHLGVLFVRRGDPGHGAVALRKARRLLRAGISVLVFPEGTTSWGGDVLPFRRGIFGLAQIEGVPVTPAALRYASRDVCWVGDTGFVPHLLSLHRYARVEAALTIGDVLEARRFSDPDALATAAHRAVRGLLRS